MKENHSSYQSAEIRANRYFKKLREETIEKHFIPVLTADMSEWKVNHINFRLHKGAKKDPSIGYRPYLQWLDYTGKLDSYLRRSVAYLYMRDLGKAIDTDKAEKEIDQTAQRLKKHVANPSNEKADSLSKASLYRWGEKEGIELSVIWLFAKLKRVSEHIPDELDAEHAQRKLIKIIAGVLLHAYDEMGEDIQGDERAAKLDEAIRLGYAYGLTYPFVDDLLDSSYLTSEEKEQYSAMIRTALLTREIPPLGDWAENKKKLIAYIHAELSEAFAYIKSHQTPEALNTFFSESYVFFHAQELDRNKDMNELIYTNEELYVPVILKSASSRLIIRSVIGAQEDKGFDDRTFYYGIYNQLADDFTDLFDDLQAGAVTPYTYYWTHHKERPDLVNPFELYFGVIANLIHDVYSDSELAREVILDRAINGLKRNKLRFGPNRYKEVMAVFAAGMPEFMRIIQRFVKKAEDVDFFDKLLRDHMIDHLREDRQGRDAFTVLASELRDEMHSFLPIEEAIIGELPEERTLHEAANYSLMADGKRIRPVVAWMMGMELGLKKQEMIPVLKSLEYMHTASLIFDDLPSQDNAAARRGQPALHIAYNSAIAELTGIFLIQKATLEQASIQAFSPQAVLSLIQYSAKAAMDMCRGQVLDLEEKTGEMSLEELNTMCFYKTGIGFEASLIMPAILAEADEQEKLALKRFAQHAGIAFQIRDDLLDAEGDEETLGKTAGQDEKNERSTFVTVLGFDGARKQMWHHYCEAIETLPQIKCNTSFLKHLLDYIINRSR
ncbi:polyprenyl synthetase family protein [Pradoshia eiseniae]|nr:polyprenyl synthetase family protein [Pradoshia eiseniae]